MGFRLEIRTPKKLLYGGTILSLITPGVEGFFGILSHHAPLVARTEGGKVSARETSNAQRFFRIGQGVVEVLKNRVVILTKEAEEYKPI